MAHPSWSVTGETRDPRVVVRLYRCGMAHTAKSKRKRSWYRHGVHGINCVVEQYGDAYLCPICLQPFTAEQIDDLSFEHAPPESVGGVEVALTCRSCNSHAGHAMDVHALRQSTLYDFITGRAPGSAKVTVEHGGVPIRGTLDFGPDGMVMLGAPKANHPDNVRRAAERAPAEGDTFTIRFEESFSDRLAKLSWVRAAYVAAFAWFGYHYILNHAFDPLREQILQPDSEILRSLPILGDPEQYGDATDRHVSMISEPFDAVIVSMGWLHVFLPGPSMPVDFFDTIEPRIREVTGAGDDGGRVNLTATLSLRLAWPEGPNHGWDG